MKTEDLTKIEDNISAMQLKDIGVLRRLAKHTANRFQLESLTHAFGIVASDLTARETIYYLTHPELPIEEPTIPPQKQRFYNPSIEETMLKLEELAIADIEAEKKARPWQDFGKGVWWSSVARFVEGIEKSRSGLNLERTETLEILRAAYKNEGIDMDVVGITDLVSLLEKTDTTKTASLVIFGREAEIPYCDESKKLLESTREKLTSGWRTAHCGPTARLLETLIDFQAPNDLLLSVNKAVLAGWASDGYPIHLRPQDILRYHLARKAEREYVRTVIETEKLHRNDFHYSHFLDSEIKDPRIYRFLTTQILRGASSTEAHNILETLGEIEHDRKTVHSLGLVLTGRKTSLDELLEFLGTQELPFLGGSPTHMMDCEISPLPDLIRTAKKRPNKGVLSYLRDAVGTGCDVNDFCKIAAEFPYTMRGEKPNSGERAAFSRKAFGKGFKRNHTKHQPQIISHMPKDPLLSSVFALNSVYDVDSGLTHDVVVGNHVEDYVRNCATLACVNLEEGVLHTILPHSMMFDATIKETDCIGCAKASFCNGMHDYTSLVLFDPANFDPEFLKRLEKTIPGAFELHRAPDGLHKIGSFAMFPEKMSLVYFNPVTTDNFTPVSTGDPKQNLVAFPLNLRGSVYLAKSLRARQILGKDVEWMDDEGVYFTGSEMINGDEFQSVRRRMRHLAGREITLNITAPDRRTKPESSRAVCYNPAAEDFEFRDSLLRGHHLDKDDTLVIAPKYQRAIA
ncbi:MAG: hypothetical protein WC796_00385 [Candidatus Pacearchaeota archaeon]|jgi:hypothetical protein